MSRNANYYKKAAKRMENAAKTCKDENKGCFRKAAEYAKDRFLEAILVVLICCVLISSGCATIKGACQDTAWMLTEVSDNIDTTDH